MKKIILSGIAIVLICAGALFANAQDSTKKADCCVEGKACCPNGACCVAK
ncbi:MAG: hypothetical protein SFU91_13600 [Chloroherpetonaceae bacterium]|nr:hypothetical protein [Chloroherpetonaceae bacterium]